MRADGDRTLATMNGTLLAFVVMTSFGLGCSPPRSVSAEAAPSHPESGSSGHVTGAAQARRAVVYASEREQLHTLALDGQTGELAVIASVSLPEQVHYAAADPGARFLYVSTSDGAGRHGLHAFAIDPQTGALAEHGPALEPPLGRIIHLSVDPAGRHLVLAHNRAAQLSSVRLADDGRLAGFVEQAAPAQTGFFTHQASFDRAGTRLVACGLGADASDATPEQPGSLTLFRFEEGQLTREQTVLPGPGLGPRHLDHAGDHVFVAVERGNRLFTYRYAEGVLEERPEFDSPTLEDPDHVQPGQRAGAIHLHPSGKYLYVSNRANRTTSVTLAGRPEEVFAGGTNDIALFAIEPGSSEPRRLEHYQTLGFEPRTFTIEPRGRFLIVANQSERQVLERQVAARSAPAGSVVEPGGPAAGGSLATVPRSLVVFEIGEEGRLAFRQRYEFTRGDLFWIGSLQLPG